MENPNERIGLVLALSSSVFIGSSFIIKKKGLIRARSTGSGAGDGGFAYLRESLWWIGMVTMIGGEAANFAAYAYAPAILVTPLGALSVLMSAVLASWLLDEKLLLEGKIGCVLCIVGSTVIVLNAPEEKEMQTVEEITERMSGNIGFLLYVTFVTIASLYLIYVVAPRDGKRNIFVYITICSVVGSISVIGVKALGLAVRLTLSGNNQLGHGSTWMYLFAVLVCIMTQMNYLNKALDTFNTALVTPIYYVLFTTCTILASALLFEGWSYETDCKPGEACVEANYSPSALITCVCGFLTICAGVYMLHESREKSQRLLASDQNDDDFISRQVGRDGEAVPMRTITVHPHRPSGSEADDHDDSGEENMSSVLLARG